MIDTISVIINWIGLGALIFLGVLMFLPEIKNWLNKKE